jgi:ABC-type branched-subunit amino acid transport system ATPase component/ABC-type branched-subunit amino acid transport system permease subunit
VIQRLRASLTDSRDVAAIAAASVVAPLLLAAALRHPVSVPLPVLLLGLMVGLTYGLLAMGLVLVYRTSGVVNFAHGEVGTLAASFFGIWVAPSAVGGFGLPFWLMLPLALGAGALANVGVEALAVRRLRGAPKVMSLVMTIGAGSFLLFVALAINTKIRNGSQYPRPPGLPTFHVGALTITPEYSGMLILTPILVALLGLFLTRTRFGVGLRAAADNRDSALLSGIPADRLSSVAWAIAGVTSALVAILQFPQKGFVIGGAALGASLLVRALLAASVARLTSLPVALGFGVLVGIIEQVSLWNTASKGPTEMLLFALLLVVLLLQSRGAGGAERREDWTDAQPWPALPAAALAVRRLRMARPASMVAGGVAFVVIGLWSNRVSLAFTLVVAYALVGLSVYVITGMTGELSLGQFAVAGAGAVVSAHFVADVFKSIPVGVLAGGVTGAVLSLALGLPALRIRGLMLAVTTLSFAVAAEAWVLPQSWAVGAGLQPSQLVFRNARVGSARGYFLFSLPFLAAGLWLVRNLAGGGYGRMLRGLRDNEDGARAFGVAATRRKLEAFAVAGFLAGCGGALLAHGLPRLTIDTFAAQRSITVVAVALIGGLALMIGPLLGALYLLALPALVHLDEVGLAVSTLGWLVLLLYFPGGLAQAVKPLRDRVVAWLARGPADAVNAAAADADVVGAINAAASDAAPARAKKKRGPVGPPLLEVRQLSKRFGGTAAVVDASLTVMAGETVGVIGPNGAGKTTLFSLIGGFNLPDQGTVLFDGIDVSDMRPEQRSQLGLVRSFQDARLFPTLTVRETLALALERTMPTRLWSALAAWPTAVESEQAKAARVGELVEVMGLDAYADTPIRQLSTGTRRIAELAAIVALAPRLVLLDEPSSGVAQRETEALGALLARLKTLLQTTFVVIEHDMPLLLGISDRIVAMESGAVIAEGAPADVVNHPDVVASYLGTDRRVVQRSGRPAPALRPRAAT